MSKNHYEKLTEHITRKAREGDIRSPFSGTNFNTGSTASTAETVTLRDEQGNSYHPFILGVDSLADESARLI